LPSRLIEDGFDIAFSLALPRPDEGIGHAFNRPYFHLRPAYDIPTVPFFVNCYYGPPILMAGGRSSILTIQNR